MGTFIGRADELAALEAWWDAPALGVTAADIFSPRGVEPSA
jgi:hypothetical protein